MTKQLIIKTDNAEKLALAIKILELNGFEVEEIENPEPPTKGKGSIFDWAGMWKDYDIDIKKLRSK
ncbi:MAG: hypothetical protein MUE85_17770 [Microscillaceae bacterium]|jgi:hypothetical protein|nr:hypothetical protein [Microscillaceae bacterium]